MRRLAFAAIAGIGLLACGDSVTVQGGDGGGTGTGTGSGTSTGTATGTGTGTPSGSSGKECSPAHPPCPPDEWCDYPGMTCGGVGVCTNKPSGCDDDCPGVCGCEGEFYCNECEAQQAGTDIMPGVCVSDDIAHAATAWPGGFDHIIISRANNTQNTCVRIFVDAPIMTGSFNITVPPPWAVTQIIASDTAAGCLDGMTPPPGETAVPIAATGTIQYVGGMLYPCDIHVDATLSFQPAPAWLDATVIFDAMDVMVQGGCF